jgi:hypothetical protein
MGQDPSAWSDSLHAHGHIDNCRRILWGHDLFLDVVRTSDGFNDIPACLLLRALQARNEYVMKRSRHLLSFHVKQLKRLFGDASPWTK